MKKQKHNQKGYLLGKNVDNEFVYLAVPRWECNWYLGFGYLQIYKEGWGFGYLQTYKEGSLNMTSRSHYSEIEGLHINECKDFTETVLNEEESYTLSELIKSFYILKETAALYHMGSAHISSNPLHDLLKSKEKEKEINEVLLPAILIEIDKLLTHKRK
jgi:hypothetical protein